MSKTKGSARLAKAKGTPRGKAIATTEAAKTKPSTRSATATEEVLVPPTQVDLTQDKAVLTDESQHGSPKAAPSSDDKVEVLEPTPTKPKAKDAEETKVEDVTDEEETESQREVDEGVLDLSDMEEDEETEMPGFTSYYWNGEQPTPAGIVASCFALISPYEQVQQIETILTYNQNRSPTVIIRAVTNSFMPFLVAVPGAGRKVKVIYNLAWAEEEEGLRETTLAGNILALTGELIPGIQLPRALVLPAKAIEAKPTKVPEGMEFEQGEMFIEDRKIQTATSPDMLDEKHTEKVVKAPDEKEVEKVEHNPKD